LYECETGGIQFCVEVFEVVAFSFVSVEFHLHSEKWAQFIEEKDLSGAGCGQQQFSVFFEDAVDFLQASVIIIQVFEIVKADDFVERIVFEWDAVCSKLYDVVFEKIERGFAVD